MTRVVVSMATLPQRIDHIQPGVEALLAQGPDVLYIWLCHEYRRFPGARVVVPPELAVLADRDDRVQLRYTEDLGPLTKVAPAVAAEPAPDTLVVSADDDVIYPDGWLRGLVGASARFPQCAVGYMGRTLTETLRYDDTLLVTRTSRATPTDILLGVCGAAYRCGLFDETLFTAKRYPWALSNDDIWMSGLLARDGVRRLVIPGAPVGHRDSVNSIDPLWRVNRPKPDQMSNNDMGIQHFARYHQRRARTPSLPRTRRCRG